MSAHLSCANAKLLYALIKAGKPTAEREAALEILEPLLPRSRESLIGTTVGKARVLATVPNRKNQYRCSCVACGAPFFAHAKTVRKGSAFRFGCGCLRPALKPRHHRTGRFTQALESVRAVNAERRAS